MHRSGCGGFTITGLSEVKGVGRIFPSRFGIPEISAWFRFDATAIPDKYPSIFIEIYP
jgi:hypothetical protein